MVFIDKWKRRSLTHMEIKKYQINREMGILTCNHIKMIGGFQCISSKLEIRWNGHETGEKNTHKLETCSERAI